MVPSRVVRRYDSALAGAAVAIAVVTARRIRARPGTRLPLAMDRTCRKSDTELEFAKISWTYDAIAGSEPGKSAARQIHLQPDSGRRSTLRTWRAASA